MANYVCTKLVLNVCHQWAELPPSGLDYLAITQTQANQIMIASLGVVFSAWSIRQVLNLIYRRRY